MKKFLAILISSVLVLAFSVPVFAHNWPSNINDWTDDDWRAWNETWKSHSYNGSSHHRERRDEWNYYQNDNYNRNYNYNYNYNNYSGYNYYAGILDVYDGATEDQAMVLARIMNYYAHGVASQTTQAGVGWAVLNSVDITGGNANVCTVAPNYYYDYSNNVTDDFGRSLLPLARDVLLRWKAGRAGIGNNGRVLPSGYWCVFSNGVNVTFGTNASAGSGSAIETFSYACPSPYGN